MNSYNYFQSTTANYLESVFKTYSNGTKPIGKFLRDRFMHIEVEARFTSWCLH